MSEGRRVPWVTFAICLAVMALCAWPLIAFYPSLSLLLDPQRTLKNYYIPSASMLPTLEVDDVVRPLRLESKDIKRGMILVFSSAGAVRIGRAVGLAGDVIALRKGIPYLNKQPMPQHRIGPGPTIEGEYPTERFAEQLPGEGRWHEVLDAGTSEGDEMREVRVPTASVFVLGDNRDFAADSRFPISQSGVAMVPARAVIGIVDRLIWSKNRARIGVQIDRAFDSNGKPLEH